MNEFFGKVSWPTVIVVVILFVVVLPLVFGVLRKA